MTIGPAGAHCAGRFVFAGGAHHRRSAASPRADADMQLDLYVNYRGCCEEAFRFYQEVLRGRVLSLIRHGDQPGSTLPEEWQAKVLHARMEIGGTVLMGADIPTAEPMRSAYLTLRLDSVDEAERIYAALGEGGEIFMKMDETPFAKRFAMLRDRFGASWMLLHWTQAG